ncbi:MAG: 50S ribosomal protein L3 [Nitrospinae bacterium]|nr:50S ribosomal protein L3 [Nitrospinota bacterium]MZH04838.1 50S ribosomal protein L3 [Nitrospinota bacterium]MZH14335.1 50S ribosomal protein L3 [Nitrospinota bacterium]
MSALLGKKLGMTQVFNEKGDCVPVTVVQVERCVPVLKRTVEKDGYDAVLLGYGNRKPKHTNKPLQGFYDRHKVEPARILKEFRNQDVDDDAIGKPIKVDIFSEGDEVEVVGVTKGRGFAGVFKRYNYGGAPASHGHHESYRGTGSVGMHTYPGRVLKGMGMPGRMGGKTKHLKNLKVVRVDVENNVLLLKGSVPGANGGLLRIFKS